MNRYCREISIKDLESIIESNQRNFYAVGKALKEIRDKRLYRKLGCDSFESYTKQRWDMKKSHTYRLINASEVIDNLSPIGEIKPINEAQARPLAVFDAFEQKKIWRQFLKSGKDITASNIRKYISEYFPGRQTMIGPSRIEIIDESYLEAVMALLYQIRVAQSSQWKSTSRDAAIYWNKVMKEKILWGK